MHFLSQEMFGEAYRCCHEVHFDTCSKVRCIWIRLQQGCISDPTRGAYSAPQTLSLVPCEYSKMFENSNSYFTIPFDSKWIQLFQIFKYLSLLHDAILSNYNGTKLSPSLVYSQSPFWVTTVAKNSDKLSQFRTTIVAKNGNKLSVWERQKLFESIQNFK